MVIRLSMMYVNFCSLHFRFHRIYLMSIHFLRGLHYCGAWSLLLLLLLLLFSFPMRFFSEVFSVEISLEPWSARTTSITTTVQARAGNLDPINKVKSVQSTKQYTHKQNSLSHSNICKQIGDHHRSEFSIRYRVQNFPQRVRFQSDIHCWQTNWWFWGASGKCFKRFW